MTAFLHCKYYCLFSESPDRLSVFHNPSMADSLKAQKIKIKQHSVYQLDFLLSAEALCYSFVEIQS